MTQFVTEISKMVYLRLRKVNVLLFCITTNTRFFLFGIQEQEQMAKNELPQYNEKWKLTDVSKHRL